ARYAGGELYLGNDLPADRHQHRPRGRRPDGGVFFRSDDTDGGGGFNACRRRDRVGGGEGGVTEDGEEATAIRRSDHRRAAAPSGFRRSCFAPQDCLPGSPAARQPPTELRWL